MAISTGSKGWGAASAASMSPSSPVMSSSEGGVILAGSKISLVTFICPVTSKSSEAGSRGNWPCGSNRFQIASPSVRPASE
ncbi:hypothetical protein D9M69_660660 [compost metagenome]